MSDKVSQALPRGLIRLDPRVVDNYLAGQGSGFVPQGFVNPWFKRVPMALSELFRGRPLPEPDPRREDDDATLRFLDGIQGNILSPHGRDYSVLLFFRYEGTAEQMRSYIAEADRHVTSALVQYQQARYRYKYPDQSFVSFALTKDGLSLAGCRMPFEKDVSFQSGMYARKGRLLDAEWEKGPLSDQAPIHGLWLLASAQPELLEKLEKEIRNLGAGRATVVMRQPGVIMRNDQGDAVEPFGFRDGISMPEFFVKESPSAGLTNLPLNRVLLDANEEERGGSFLVFRKLQQHVEKFRAFERELAVQARQAGIDPADTGRLVFGRKRDGMPLAQLDPTAVTAAKVDLNGFNFVNDETESRCPFHAHIRKANPRSLIGKIDRKDDMELNTQFVRRGVVYNPDNSTRFDPVSPPPEDTGLLFLAYMADISDQFEFMQANWLSQAESPAAPVNRPDPVLYGGRTPVDKWEWSGLKANLPAFVTTVGGAYLFVPPRHWLRNPPLVVDEPGSHQF